MRYPDLRPSAPHQLIQADILPKYLSGGTAIACFNAISALLYRNCRASRHHRQLHGHSPAEWQQPPSQTIPLDFYLLDQLPLTVWRVHLLRAVEPAVIVRVVNRDWVVPVAAPSKACGSPAPIRSRALPSRSSIRPRVSLTASVWRTTPSRAKRIWCPSPRCSVRPLGPGQPASHRRLRPVPSPRGPVHDVLKVDTKPSLTGSFILSSSDQGNVPDRRVDHDLA